MMLPWNIATSLTGFEAKIGNVVYYVNVGARGLGGNATFVMVHGRRGGKRRLNLGNYETIDEAKRRCEQHYADGCDVSEAQR